MNPSIKYPQLLDCFLIDDISRVGCVPLYDTDANKPVLFATPTGDIGQAVPERGAFVVPTFFMDDKTLEECAAKILIRAALSNRKRMHFSLRDARKTFARRGLQFMKLLTNKDHDKIPEDLAIAVAEPEYLGRCVFDTIWSKPPKPTRGLVLFNFSSVIGYQPGNANESRNRKNRRHPASKRVQHR